MSVVWTKGPVSASDVVEALGERKGWHSRTTRTLLDRLTKKKALKILPKEKPNLYEALISMEQAVRQESRSLSGARLLAVEQSHAVACRRRVEALPKNMQEAQGDAFGKEK